jgi:ABC-type transporter Mla MlaB component
MIQGVRPHSDSSGLAVLVDFWRGCREVQEEAQGLHAPGSNGVLPGPCPP